MALPSQSARSAAAGRSFGTRRRQRLPQPLAVAGTVAMVALAGLCWWGLSDGGEPQPVEKLAANNDPSDAGRLLGSPQVTPEKKPEPKPTQPAPKVEPKPPPVVEIGQGRLAAANQPPAINPLASTTPTPTTPAPGAVPAIKDPVREPATAPQTPPQTPAQTPPPGDPVAARVQMSRTILDPATPEPERARLRTELAAINENLVFSPVANAADPFVTIYAVQSGDALEKIARKTGAAGHWRLIQRINRLANPNRIQLNQKLKVVKGPFHAVVSKSAFRMDLFMGDPAQPAQWLYVRSFPVGLGEGGGTPIARFVVKRNSKLENPYWVNPRTGEQFGKDDPNNPIGERWIGLEGVGESAAHTSYGIHGTIDPDSIGKEKSMGCIRMSGPDVEWVYDLLSEGVSTVEVRP